ncbi:MAG: S8 family serine peptidase [Bdellovibrionales bacterium]|jgi:thermitase|nr:S8 family serine peptidase [Bdellovibrionales bacterium]MBT3526168.1 S8 family serine peptidase [Bdellovibrionales bacterium]MBT7766420.1 S8 family serine peptidase [Bdellovibrionales bacterium]
MAKQLLPLIVLIIFAVQAQAGTRYIVKLKDGAAKSFLAQKSNLRLGSFQDMKLSFGDYLTLETDDNKSLNILSSHPDVAYIEPSIKLSIYPVITHNDEGGDTKEITTMNDPKFTKQWGLINTGSNSGWFFGGTKGEDVNVKQAWDISTGNQDLIVAVIDTGVDHDHPDLAQNMWTNQQELNGKEGVDDDGNGFIDDIHGYDFSNNDGDPNDDNGHGTHCAGNIGAIHNNNEGVAGVMGNVKLMGLKFLSRGGSGESEDAIKSIDYAVRMGAKVLSNSWGGGEKSQALKDAIVAANQAGVVFIAAAGNSRRNHDSSPSYPAAYKVDNVLSVGSMAGSGKKSGFSDYGASTVHIFAPGSGIMSTYKGGGYKKLSGTSMAAPLASGVVGLLLASEPELTPKEVVDRLVNTAAKTKALDGKSISNGRVDAYRALQNIDN